MWPTPTRCSRTWRARKDGGSATGVPWCTAPAPAGTFFRALRVGPRLAALVGSVVVDVEEVDARGDPEPRIDDDEASSSPAADDEGFEHVAACRRATLAEFYTMIQPALRQIAVDRVPMRASLSAPPSRSSGAIDGVLEDDEDLCAVCFDGALEVVTRCGHSYCEECYLRWLSISRECPLCRERLGAELRGGNNGSYALVGAGNLSRDGNGDGDGDGEGVDAEWLRGRLEALPAVEDPGARRARVAYLMAKLREKGEGARDADTGEWAPPPVSVAVVSSLLCPGDTSRNSPNSDEETTTRGAMRSRRGSARAGARRRRRWGPGVGRWSRRCLRYGAVCAGCVTRRRFRRCRASRARRRR